MDRFRGDREDVTEDIEREVEGRWRDDSFTVDAATVVERAETGEELEDVRAQGRRGAGDGRRCEGSR